MWKIKAYYHFLQNFSLEGLDVARDENDIPTISFKGESEFVQFMKDNNLSPHRLAEGTVVAVTNEEEPNVYGKIIKE